MVITNHPIITPAKALAEWADAEIGVIIHLDLISFVPDYDFRRHFGDPLPASVFNPVSLDTDQWIAAARSLGAKYAVLVAKHCTGFSLWPTDAHDYSVKSAPWKGGKGDIVADFVASCEKFGLKPGLYCSASANQFMNVDNPGLMRSGDPMAQTRYNDIVMQQLTELWSNYGKLFEIWFDGGVLPADEGGPDVGGLLSRLQPNSAVFQGPADYPSVVRWVGNERGHAAEDCSSLFNYSYEGTSDGGTQERNDTGDTYGNTWSPAEADLPNRRNRSHQGGWFWKAGEDDAVIPAEELFDVYKKSVGRNCNMLVGMAINSDGLFSHRDCEAFERFGKLLKVFDKPVSAPFMDKGDGVFESAAEIKGAGYLTVGEDITKGERITAYTVEAFGTGGDRVYLKEGRIIGHKRLFELPQEAVRARLTVKQCKSTPCIMFMNIY